MPEAQHSAGRWHRLDNTANLFPVITTRRSTNVYRLFMTLEQPVVPELLQKALEIVLPKFAAFRVRMRRGLFWHYLEANPGMPTVYEEDSYPCTYIDPKQNNNFLFRVTYFENRINLEVFHVLTDGTGGIQFLSALVCRYLLLAYPTHFTPEERARQWFLQHAQDTEDSYVANYVPTKKADFRIGKAFRLTGERSILNNMGVMHTHIPVGPLLQLCRGKGVTITQYLTAVIGWAVYTQQMHSRPPRHPLNIFTPVNLRNLFPSTTSLNFFSNIYISLSFKGDGLTFEDVLQDVKTQFEEKMTRQSMQEKISYTVGSGYSLLVRMVPLPLKTLFLRAMYEASAGSSSMGVSSLGIIKMPAIFEKYVTGFAFLLSCAPQEPFKCTIGTYGDVLTISFCSILRNTALQRSIVRQLTAEGLDITIETSGVNYENL